MSLFASAWLTSAGGASINFWNTDGWTSNAWALNLTPPDMPVNRTLIYGQNLSGVGTLHEDDRLLRINLPIAPVGPFTITVAGLSKNFEMLDASMKGSVILSGVPSARLQTLWRNLEYENLTYVGQSGFAAFSPDDRTIRGGTHKAFIHKNGVRVGFAMGTAFTSVVRTGGVFGRVWPYGGIFFYRFHWLGAVPTALEEYKMEITMQYRGSGSVTVDKFVTIGPDTFIGDTNVGYDVLPEDTFTMRGVLT